MPNHIKNRIEIKGDAQMINNCYQAFNTHHKASLNLTHDKSKIICRKLGEEWGVGWFDAKTGVFSRREEEDVIGLPDNYEFEINDAYNHFPDFQKVMPPPENIFNGDLGQKEREMCIQEGRPNWYDWNRKNWGTKWNSYSCEKLEDGSFTFETAWSGVPELMRLISSKFPELEIKYEWSDEDTGYNCGYATFKNGIGDVIRLEGGSKESYELAFKLRPHYKDDYKLIDGKYQYVDSEEELTTT